MSFSLIHLSDLHFGECCDLTQIEAIETLVPDLEPELIVISGDVSLRARHGEFQAAQAFVRGLQRSAPVHVIPGNHDVQWWWRPFIPFDASAKYWKYRTYFGPDLTPTTELPGAIVASALTSHGVAWGSLTPRLRDIAVKGHLPKREMKRVRALFDAAAPEAVRVLVVHHNVLRGDLSQRMGLARWKQAQARILESGAELVLCGHDHQERADTLGGRVIVSCAGTPTSRTRGGRPSVFNRVVVEPASIHVELYRWDAPRGVYRRSDTYAFARTRTVHEAVVDTAAD
jgi:3',5'-cyclic AMP phosphodiesterase CpdA